MVCKALLYSLPHLIQAFAAGQRAAVHPFLWKFVKDTDQWPSTIRLKGLGNYEADAWNWLLDHTDVQKGDFMWFDVMWSHSFSQPILCYWGTELIIATQFTGQSLAQVSLFNLAQGSE